MRRRYLPELLVPPGDELFSLILASVPCYEYDMDNHTKHSRPSRGAPRPSRDRVSRKIIF